MLAYDEAPEPHETLCQMPRPNAYWAPGSPTRICPVPFDGVVPVERYQPSIVKLTSPLNVSAPPWPISLADVPSPATAVCEVSLRSGPETPHVTPVELYEPLRELPEASHIVNPAPPSLNG